MAGLAPNPVSKDQFNRQGMQSGAGGVSAAAPLVSKDSHSGEKDKINKDAFSSKGKNHHSEDKSQPFLVKKDSS